MTTHNEFLASQNERARQWQYTQKIRSLAGSPRQETNRRIVVDGEHILRNLGSNEIETLTKHCGCTCRDWSHVFLLLSPTHQGSNDQSLLLRDLVTNTNFEGTCVLVIANTQNTDYLNDSSLQPFSRSRLGIHNNFLISNSIISAQSWVCNNITICDTHVHPYSVVMGCGSIAGASTDSKIFAQKGAITLSVGPESGGGREITLLPEGDMTDVCRQLTKGGAPKPLRDLSVVRDCLVVNMNIISSFCIVRSTPSIKGIYLAPRSSIQAATSVTDSILFSTATIQNGSIAENVRLQWSASIMDNSRVSDAFLMEEGHVGPNSLVASSIIGPDSHVSSGEVQCSVLGPNTNSHHQSLVISVLWILGRGNVGYGSNIGSNHTGRIPDQELTSGEGVFWGLSCVIKFPVDMVMSPYSIVAAGTTLPPQRVCMPFSLIVSSNDGSNNSIIPGWLLSSSPYTIARNEKKFATRRKASRHQHYTGWKIIRPDTVHMCRWARRQLQSVTQHVESLPTSYDTDKAIRGIGSNKLTEKGRRAGIAAYTNCIQQFALAGLLSWLIRQEDRGGIDLAALQIEKGRTGSSFDDICSAVDHVAWPASPWEMPTSRIWEYQKWLLCEEFPRKTDLASWVVELLQRLIKLEKNWAAKVYKSKSRDDQRGTQTIPSYAQCHTAAQDDPVIVEAKKRADDVEIEANRLIASVRKWQRSKL